MTQLKYPNRSITKPQIKKIHTLISNLGFSDDHYRALLYRFDVESSTELNREKAAIIIDILLNIEKEQKGETTHIQKPTGVLTENRVVYFDRKGKATDAQLEYIAGLWIKVSNQKTYASLMWFIKKVTGKLYIHLESLNMKETSKIINALKSWENSTSTTSQAQR